MLFHRSETKRLNEIIWNMGVRHLEEQAKLLDRIQFPATRQVEPGEVREYDPPTDAGELASVGTIDYGNLDDDVT
jgi:hypothetical protein